MGPGAGTHPMPIATIIFMIKFIYIIGIYFKPFIQIKKDFFCKNTDFFKCQICPDKRTRQAEQQPNQPIGQSVAQKERKTAQCGEVTDTAQHSKNVHKNALAALSQRQPQQKQRQARDQPEQEVCDGRHRL
jgi:hypothetical protein